MRIGINTLFLIPGQNGGTETYLRNLLLNLAKVDKENEYVLFTNKENSGSLGIEQDNFCEVSCPITARFKPLRVFWEQTILPRMLKQYEIDVIHYPAYVSPILKFFNQHSVVTIHDMMYYYFPENYPRGQLLYFKNFIPLSAKKVNKIIAISRNTKKDIVEILKIPESKVAVSYVGYDNTRFNAYLDEGIKKKVKKKYELPDQFILSVAFLYQRSKNIHGLVKALSIVKNKYGVSDKLVLVGRKLRYYSEVKALIEKLDLTRDVIFTGYVPDEDLPYVYSLASLYVFPSLFEGFGLPPLEAMACGCPVVASNAASIPEVVGDAGVLMDPYAIEKMAEAIYSVLINDSLKKDLIRKGLERVKQFSWEKAAIETLKVYKEIYKS